ncbi:trypsin-like serine protease [Photobacterium indicum]|uniref:Trypsin n=1 Tax=Photobacterium indicum TaxID=81447 RepID=A0A2T3LC10_9GAMM|nr:trypsin-like serine protease [Photobacterium indicum]PSV48875.1 trypsin [Photobacterium indicum]
MTKAFVSCLLFWFALVVFQAKADDKVAATAKIIGGIESSQNEVPWQAYLNMTYSTDNGSETFVCGGVVIASQVVLTAAHCMQNGATTVRAENVKVWAGITSVFSARTSNAVLVTKVILHPSYNDGRFANDIALLVLGAPLPVASIPILPATRAEQQLADNEFVNGWVANGQRPANLLVSGWGATQIEPDNSAGSTTLRQTLLSGVPDTTCDNVWGSNISASELSIFLCAGSTSPLLARDSCFGDSGGPLVWQNVQKASDNDFGLRLVGLVSFGEGCAGLLPGVYTEVAQYHDWITGLLSSELNIEAMIMPQFTVNPFHSDYTGAGSDIATPSTTGVTSDDSGGSLGFFSVLFMAAFIRWRRS